MLPDRVSNPGPLTYESGALPIALCGPAESQCICDIAFPHNSCSLFLCLNAEAIPRLSWVKTRLEVKLPLKLK